MIRYPIVELALHKPNPNCSPWLWSNLVRLSMLGNCLSHSIYEPIATAFGERIESLGLDHLSVFELHHNYLFQPCPAFVTIFDTFLCHLSLTQTW